MPKVSVIVPNYNHSRYLNQRIDSILSQTFQDFELILLDDCSTDNSRDVLEQYRGNDYVSHIVYNEVNGGSPFAQWNRGIELAQGEWIWIAESDDWAEKDFLETIISVVDDLPACGLAYTWTRFVSDTDVLWEPSAEYSYALYKGEDYIRQRLLTGNPIFNVSMALIRKSAFNQINHYLYNTMTLCGDWFLYILIAEVSDVAEIKKVCSNYRMHPGSTSNNTECKGFTFSEGKVILDYCTKNLYISSKFFSRNWGKQLFRYEKKFNIPKRIITHIIREYMHDYPLIVLYYFLYRFRHILPSCSQK